MVGPCRAHCMSRTSTTVVKWSFSSETLLGWSVTGRAILGGDTRKAQLVHRLLPEWKMMQWNCQTLSRFLITRPVSHRQTPGTCPFWLLPVPTSRVRLDLSLTPLLRATGSHWTISWWRVQTCSTLFQIFSSGFGRDRLALRLTSLQCSVKFWSKTRTTFLTVSV